MTLFKSKWDPWEGWASGNCTGNSNSQHVILFYLDSSTNTSSNLTSQALLQHKSYFLQFFFTFSGKQL